MKKKGKKRWILYASIGGGIAVLLTAATIALEHPEIHPVINTVLGGNRPRFEAGIEPVFTGDYSRKEDALRAANALNEEVAGESFVLLKNKGGALPLSTPESPEPSESRLRVSVFGQNSIDLALGGSGSGASSGGDTVDLYESLDHAGFEVNPTLKNFYEKSTYRRGSNSSDLDSGDTVYQATGEAPQSAYTDEVKESYSSYKDAAIVVFTRIGGEGFDLPRTMKGQSGARAEDDHYLQLDQNETDLFKAVTTSGFDKVIVLINSGTPMELAFLEDPDYYAYQEGIDAALWIGFPGNSGAEAIGKVLNGTIDPSGRTVDIYAKDFKADPTWYNFGDNRVENGDRLRYDGALTLYYSVSYEEGIYSGYRYYETRGATDGEDWYDEAVVYPFGYGLSYTDFQWELVSGETFSALNKDDTYTVTLRVTNTGTRAGKDVVELYGHAPYFSGEIEKSEEVLLDFNKTQLLQPGESEEVTLSFDLYSLASYDAEDRNGNGFKGYELDPGEYRFTVNRNSHESLFTLSGNLTENLRYEEDPTTGTPVNNLYTDQEDERFNSAFGLTSVLSRADWEGTFPTPPTESDLTMDEELHEALINTETNNPEVSSYEEEEPPFFEDPVTLTLRDLLKDGEESFDKVDYDDERWEEILNECSIEELENLFNQGAFKSESILPIGKNLTNDTDGPAGFTNFMSRDGTYWGTCHYCAEINMGSTWNVDLIQRVGEMVGNEGILGAAGRGNGLSYSGWYAPGVNLHRSPFGGRNFEYFSEDGRLNGKLAAAEIRGCRSRGVYCFVKHFALNEQETHRSRTGLITWADEQTIREVYLKPFELAVKEGKTLAVMSSFNRIGTTWTGGDYRLLTQILRNEWGFHGMVICDFNTIPQYMNSRQMAYAGGDLNLATQPVSWVDSSSTADLIVLRRAAKNILYTVANSNAMNYVIIGYRIPLWEEILIIVDCVVGFGLIVWGVFVLLYYLKKDDKVQN